MYKYEITDKGREKLQVYKEKENPGGGPGVMAESEILYWLDRSSKEGNDFIYNNRDTWRTDGLGRMRRSGFIERVEEES